MRIMSHGGKITYWVNENYEYAWVLGGNSTLGFLCHWMQSGKQQGRGILRKTTLRSLPTLDVTQLTPAQLAAAERVFHELKQEELSPFHKLTEDVNLQQLDRRLLEILGYSQETHPEIHEGVDLLRKKLCAEPSIHGGKK